MSSKDEDTRAIARKAVEDDFRRKKKRGYDSSDDERPAKKHSNKKDKPLKQATVKPSRPVATWEVNYRDRAKERRQGKTAVDQEEEDQQPEEDRLATRNDDLLQDILEGEPAVVIKGLDRSLLKTKDDDDDDGIEKNEPMYVENRQQALEWLAAGGEATSVLGRQVLDVLRETYLPVAPIPNVTRAGKALQATVYECSINPHQVWHKPSVTSGPPLVSPDGVLPKASRINDPNLLQRLQDVLEAKQKADTEASQQLETKSAQKARVVDDDEDIFQLDSEEGQVVATKDRPTKRTFFFRQDEATTGTTNNTVVDAETNASETVPKLERLSQVDGDYDVDFDGRIEDEEGGKKKKKRKRTKDGDDSD